jgi:hypothetical protein
MSTLSRQEGLGAMVVEKWLCDNHRAGHHLEQYDSDTLHSLMLSRIGKLSHQVAEGEIEPMRIHADSLDKIFQSILDAGLLMPTNPKIAGEKEKAAAKEATDRAQLNAEADFMLAIMRYEKAVGQRGISEWYHTKATRGQKEWYDRLFASGAISGAAEVQARQQGLFIIKTVSNGRLCYVSSDGLSGGAVVLDGDRANAFSFGNSRAHYFAELLATQRPELKIEIMPIG